MPVIPSEKWSAIEPTARTGDILLFSGNSQESQMIEDVTFSEYSHVGMLVCFEGETLIWQTGPDPITEDPKTHSMHGGAQLGRATDTLTVMLGYGDQPSYRQLNLDRDDAFEQAVQDAIGTLEGRPFPTLVDMALHLAEGRFFDKDDGEKTLFCAELIARTYMNVGLLGEDPPPDWYEPKSFSAEVPSPTLLLGASFEPEVPVTVD